MFNPFRKKDVEKKELEADLPVKKVRRRRKKEEDNKPWGKIERIIVFLFLAGIPLLSVFFLTHSLKRPQVLGDITSINSKDINVLKDNLSKNLGDKSKNYGIWVEAIDGSYKAGLNEGSQFDGASLFKLPLMMAYYQKLDEGTINPKTNYTLKYSDSMTGAGILATLPPGTIITYQDMIDYMGKNSDNSAFVIMQNILGNDTENMVIKTLKMENTDFDNNMTTAYDIGQLFIKLVNSNLLSQTSKNKLLSSLKNTAYEYLIPGGIPDNIEVAHKYAADGDELNDAGIIYTAKPFVLVILANDKDATSKIPQLSKIVYDWITK